MSGRCTFIDDVEFEPIASGNVHFTLLSGDETMQFCMSRAGVRKAAAKAERLLDAADRDQQVRLLELRAG